MSFLKTTTQKGSVAGKFKSVLLTRDIIVDGDSFDPLDNATPGTYTIPAGTAMAPVSGKYLPVRRTLCTAVAENSKTLAVANVKPFRVGDVVMLYTSIAATADGRTIAAVTAPTTVVLTAVATVAANDRLEVAATGAHGNTTAVTPTQIADVVLLANDVCVAHADGTTFDSPANGVIAGQIATEKVNGPGTAAFDTDLETQLPNIDFIPATAGV